MSVNGQRLVQPETRQFYAEFPAQTEPDAELDFDPPIDNAYEAACNEMRETKGNWRITRIDVEVKITAEKVNDL